MVILLNVPDNRKIQLAAEKKNQRNEKIFALNIWCSSKIKEKKEIKQLREEQQADLF